MSDFWSEKDFNFLKENYHFGSRYVAEKLGCSIGRVQFKAHKEGLRLTHEQKSLINIKSYEKRDENRRVKTENFTNILTPEVAYFLGFFWADGSISKSNYVIGLTILKEDMVVIESYLNKIGDWSHPEFLNNSGNLMRGCVTASKPLHSFFVETDHLNKSLCSPYKILSKIPDHLKHYWWRGYFDGDGYYSVSEPHAYENGFCGNYDQDWSFVFDLLKGLGIKASVQRQITETGKGAVVRITNKAGVFKLSEYLYQGDSNYFDMKLTRKYNDYQHLLKQSERNSPDKARARVQKSLVSAVNRFKYRGVTPMKSGKFGVKIGDVHIGTFSDKDAATNAYNYFASLRYGNFFVPSKVERNMSKDEFLKYRSHRLKNIPSIEYLESLMEKHRIEAGYENPPIQ